MQADLRHGFGVDDVDKFAVLLDDHSNVVELRFDSQSPGVCLNEEDRR